MIYAFVTLFLGCAGLAFALSMTLAKLKETKVAQTESLIKLEATNNKFKDVVDLENFKQSLSNQIRSLQDQTLEIQRANSSLTQQSEALRKQLDLYNGEQTVVDCGLYTPVYDYDILQKYKDALEETREEQKKSLKAETAATCKGTWSVNGDVKEGKRQTRDYTHLMLRAFNGEADAITASVKWNNVDRMVERLEGVYQAINKLGDTHSIKIERTYFQLKLKELHLTHEYQEKLKAEKDEQRRIQDQIREDARAQKEIEDQIRKSEDEEKRSRIALERARQELQLAQGAEVEKMNFKIQALETQLATALSNKERAKSRAEMTRAGNVYVISNIGSFGENRFKIGMTRRLDPNDRIYELGNAAVPFEFDVHAMIPTDNAPKLEAKLHDRFRDRNVNLVNSRKEFFDVGLEEIAAAVKELNADIEFIKIPEAKTFRQTLALRTSSQSVSNDPTRITVPATEYQVYVFDNGMQEGPFTFDQLNQKIVEGIINPITAQLWYDGLPTWVPISQLQQPANGTAAS